jgi:hypothetical protein
MQCALKIIVAFVVGAIWGGILGAVMLAVPTYFDNGSPPFGGKGWVIVSVYMGLVLGGITGAIIGLVVGVSNASKSKGAAIGALIGTIIMVVLFFMGAASDALVTVWAVLSVAAGALVGLISSTFVGWLRHSGKRESLPA